ncbi:MAG: phenylalanine--tRNA ligase subunit beta [Ignavibacteriae bacterium]|nr:phenylalanine--tRNA ligase subunit beta [Ignavibacteria bacterium]MBI3365499.1 phenylalanine--tRNA ligase subunit beta [Ignavibacteriota bacterium]
MRVSLHWLKEYVDFTLSAEDLAECLTMVGLEVESIEYQGKKYEKFVVGEVLEIAKHPNADRLSVCKVNTGKEAHQVVCGAPNVAEGQKVAVGLVGAVVPHNQHDPDGKPFALSHVKVRNVDSYGMICSAYELDLGDDRNGIIVLDSNAKPGIPLARYLGREDTVIEVGITPNRPDAMSHIGIAREVAALLGKRIRLPKVKVKKGSVPIKKVLTVVVEDTQRCPRYTARVIRNLQVVPSPGWLQNRLNSIGIRPVNNIVDITNYVLMEIGHPLHAFDYDKVAGQKIVVRLAQQDELFVTLDHKQRSLRSDTLLICDAERPIAVAGVMGGENSEISSSTTAIVIESAYFIPQCIRSSSKAFSLSTDASQRFERGADPNITLWAVDRAASLIQSIAGGEVLKGVIDVYPKKIQPKRITLRPTRVNEVLGTTLNHKEVSALLQKLNIRVAGKARKKVVSSTSYVVPTYRPDITEEIDLVEEVARVYGYNNIDTKTESLIKFYSYAPEWEFADELRNCLIGGGYSEVIVNSMQEKSQARLASDKVVEIANPISKDMGALRTSLIPSMLGVIRHNIFHGVKDLRLFEIGKAYFHDPSIADGTSLQGFVEKERLLLALTGIVEPVSWGRKPRSVDIFDAKGELQVLFNKISLDKIKFIPYSTTDALIDTGLHVEINGQHVGMVGSIRKGLLSMFEIEQDVYIGELTLDPLKMNRLRARTYQLLPKFPPVVRDVAFIVDGAISSEVLESAIRNAGKPLLTSIKLFDIYTGEQIENGKKSCAFSLQFLSETRTLTQEEVDRTMQHVIVQISSTFGATLRQ